MDDGKAEVLGLLDRIRKAVDRETADPHRTYNETDPVVLLVKAEDVIENLAIRTGILHGPRTVALDKIREAAAAGVRAGYAQAMAPIRGRDVAGELEHLWAKIMVYEGLLNDPHGDGSGEDAEPPTADQYNALLAMVLETLSSVLGKPNPLARAAR